MHRVLQAGIVVGAAVVITAFSASVIPPREVPPTQMAFPGRNWEVVMPEEQGLDSRRLDDAIEYLRKIGPGEGADKLVIVRRGRIIWEGPRANEVQKTWSCTKSFTSTVMGVLVDRGECSMDTNVSDILPEMKKHYPDATLRHFVTMTSGYTAIGDEKPAGTYVNGPSETWYEPGSPLFVAGTHYAYWDSAYNQLGRILTVVAGRSMKNVFERHVARPIGMDSDSWSWGEFGEKFGENVNGGSGNKHRGVRISPRAMARFGHLMLNRGRWNGRDVLSESWVEAATSVQVPADLPLGGPIDHGLKGTGFPMLGCGVYGFGWWVNGVTAMGDRRWPGLPEGVFGASGFNNNDVFIIPDWEMVVVRLGLDQGTRLIRDKEYAAFLGMIGEAITD